MISLGIAAAIGAAIGAVALGAASAATHGDVPGLAIALQHIPPTTHGYEVVTAVKNALAGGAAGGGIRAAGSAVAKAGAQGAAAAAPYLRPAALFFSAGQPRILAFASLQAAPPPRRQPRPYPCALST